MLSTMATEKMAQLAVLLADSVVTRKRFLSLSSGHVSTLARM